MNIFDIEKDLVIKGIVANGYMSYSEAFSKLIPLINKTEFQRKLQDEKFYKKLERDIAVGCVMPPITVAFVVPEVNFPQSVEACKCYVEENIENAFVLDGIQRLNTLGRLQDSPILDKDKKVYINFIFCDSSDKLLYRMITLNNGQRPMTPRHQVEAMLSNFDYFSKFGIECRIEKESSRGKSLKNAFNKSDLIQAYLAFMANSPLVDNKKIIQEKMDELIVGKIMSANDVESEQFSIVLEAISKFQSNEIAFKWLNLTNNLVGFAVGLRRSGGVILSLSVEEFVLLIEKFDKAFSDMNASKIKVGKYRRELSCLYFQHINKFLNANTDEVLEYFASVTDE